jgi:RNA polymerase sigma factor (sigma-70 family)
VGDMKAVSNGAWLEREMLPHEPWLRRYLRRSSCPVADIDDVVQECFLRIYAAGSIPEVPNPRGLLKRVARNLMIDRHRRGLGVEHVGIHAAYELPSGCCPQDELVDLRRALGRIARTFETFSPRSRDIVERRCIAGQSSREAASDLGVCSSTVDKQLRASVAALRSACDGASGEYVDLF